MYIFFFIFFSIMVYPRMLRMLHPVLNSRTLLFIRSMCASLVYAFNNVPVSLCVCLCV